MRVSEQELNDLNNLADAAEWFPYETQRASDRRKELAKACTPTIIQNLIADLTDAQDTIHTKEIEYKQAIQLASAYLNELKELRKMFNETVGGTKRDLQKKLDDQRNVNARLRKQLEKGKNDASQ